MLAVNCFFFISNLLTVNGDVTITLSYTRMVLKKKCRLIQFLKPRQFAIFILFYFHSTVFYIEWICVFPTQLKQTRIFFQLTVFLSTIIFNLLLFLLLLFFCSYCVKFFDMHKHETIMMTRFLMILCRAPRHPPGKEGVVKSVGVIFYLFLWLMSPTGGEATYVVIMSEWVSEWVMVTIEFRSWSSFCSMFTVLLILCSGVL